MTASTRSGCSMAPVTARWCTRGAVRAMLWRDCAHARLERARRSTRPTSTTRFARVVCSPRAAQAARRCCRLQWTTRCFVVQPASCGRCVLRVPQKVPSVCAPRSCADHPCVLVLTGSGSARCRGGLRAAWWRRWAVEGAARRLQVACAAVRSAGAAPPVRDRVARACCHASAGARTTRRARARRRGLAFRGRARAVADTVERACARGQRRRGGGNYNGRGAAVRASRGAAALRARGGARFRTGTGNLGVHA